MAKSIRYGDIMKIEFTQREQELLTHKLKEYLNNELNCDIGQFDAEFLLEFVSKEIGVYYYNKGLQDAQELFKSKVEMVTDAIYEIEMPTEFSGR